MASVALLGPWGTTSHPSISSSQAFPVSHRFSKGACGSFCSLTHGQALQRVGDNPKTCTSSPSSQGDRGSVGAGVTRRPHPLIPTTCFSADTPCLQTYLQQQEWDLRTQAPWTLRATDTTNQAVCMPESSPSPSLQKMEGHATRTATNESERETYIEGSGGELPSPKIWADSKQPPRLARLSPLS